MYVFMITQRGDRTNIMANFQLLSTEGIIEEIKNSKKRWGGSIRYGQLGGTVSNLKDMLLTEYEPLFKDADFTPEQVSQFFRKEISEIYGKHKIMNESVRIPKKDLEIGRLYELVNGDKVFYFGKISGTLYTPARKYSSYRNDDEPSTRELYGYLDMNGYKVEEKTNIKDVLIRSYKNYNNKMDENCYIYPLKTLRKYVKALDIKIDVPDKFEYSLNNGQVLKINFEDKEK